jgi:transcriptional regulator with XRE-family HTH domain
MVNSADFTKRLEQILTYYELSATAFANAIGVQPSSISHLLSGRNKPSLDFVLKVVQHYPEVNLYWLLNGKGAFPASTQISPSATPPTDIGKEISSQDSGTIEKIVVFYADGTFKTYNPSP